jgi:uncharacterized protein (DUF1800 family)
MGDQNTLLSTRDARHLLRRTGFGTATTPATALTGLTRGAAANKLLAFKPAGFVPRGSNMYRTHNSWVKYMVNVKYPLQEKLVLFWHDHFATSNDKVADHRRMATQNKLLRLSCKGNFKSLVKAINKDGAMMEFLDTVRNYKDQPNENYARELLELFTLGVRDLAGQPTYTQADIVQIARALTGWDWDHREKTHFHDYDHDFADEFPERGPKVIFRTTGGFLPAGSGRDYTLPQGEGPGEIDRVIDILFEHRDSTGKNTVARHIAKKMIEYFAHPLPGYPADAAIVDEIVSRSQFAVTWNIAALVREILVDDFFYASNSPVPHTESTPKSVKWPIDFVISTLRTLKVTPRGVDAYISGGSYQSLYDQLGNMGQYLFYPPSVFGWDWETAWLSSASMLARYNFARDVTGARGSGRFFFHPERLINLNLTDPGAIVTAAATVLDIDEQITTAQRNALIAYLGPGPLNLRDYDTRNAKLHGLFCLLLQCPASHLH